jgi:hypothetical protein
MRNLVVTVAGAALIAGTLQAQNEPKEPQRVEHDVIKLVDPKDNVTFERHAFAAGPDTVQYVSTEASIAGKVIKGAPYSADAVNENTQTLADGNRISSKSTFATYRDSEGRTRREMSLPPIGALATAGDTPTFIMINDPVAGVSYHLDTKTKTARKLPQMAGAVSFGVAGSFVGGVAAAGPQVAVARARVQADGKGPETFETAVPPPAAGLAIRATNPAIQIRMRNGDTPKSESLGKQTIDGVEVEGTRSTVTIPPGQIGNEREIQIVNERWYSPELQTVVMSKHVDPRMGETIYKLTDIKRGDPHPSLFQVPPDYTLATDDPPMRFMRKFETTK